VGDLRPRGQRITRDGVDLLIGPEVVGAPALQPGTRVAIYVPSVDAHAELQWPSLPLLRAPRVEGAENDGAGQPSGGARLDPEPQAAAGSEAPGLDVGNEGLRKVAELAALAAQAADRAREATAAAAANGTLDQKHDATATVASTPGDTTNVLPPPTSPIAPGSAEPLPPAAPLPAPARPARSGTAVLTPATVPAPALSNASAKILAPPPAHPTHIVVAAASNSTQGRFPAFLLGCLMAGGIAAVAYVWREQQLALQPAKTASVEAQASRTGGFAASRLAAILDVPARSPLGSTADGVDLAEALRRADASLSGGGATASRREARFWLRKALALGLGDERILWAMTQLGTLYAKPDDEAPDYEAARTLWELAAAKGDPVASCFLASLHEHGLGFPRDPARALELYERARDRGGCRGLDEAIARLRKAVP
jgi:hypothetical protein